MITFSRVKQHKMTYKDYIIGTDRTELHRLGLQHQVWESEARMAWTLADFGAGQTILDLGSGPGFCTRDLGYIVGESGKVIAVDKSKLYIDFLEAINEIHQLKLDIRYSDFDSLDLSQDQLDGVFIRWALAWASNPFEILEKIEEAMLPGAVIVAQEYFDWTTFQVEPKLAALQTGIDAIYDTYKNKQEGDIDIGRKLTGYFYDLGLEVISTRPLSKLVTPEQFAWQWPKSFLEIFLPKMVGLGYLTQKQVEYALDELYQLEELDGAAILCPHMIEVIAIKP